MPLAASGLGENMQVAREAGILSQPVASADDRLPVDFHAGSNGMYTIDVVDLYTMNEPIFVNRHR